jgi:hypothetical protein
VRAPLHVCTAEYLRQMPHADLVRVLDLTIELLGTYALLSECHMLRMRRLIARRGRLAFAKDARLAADALEQAHRCFDRCEEQMRLIGRLLDAIGGSEAKAWAEVGKEIAKMEESRCSDTSSPSTPPGPPETSS